MQNDEVQRSLGRIEGQIGGLRKSVDAMSTKVDHIDDRLRAVEIKSGVISITISSAIAALGYSLGGPSA